MSPNRSPFIRWHLALGLLVFPFLGACGDSSTGGNANKDGSFAGRDAYGNPGPDESDVLLPTTPDVSNSDTASLAEAGPTDVGLDSVGGLDGPGRLLDTGNNDVRPSEAPPALDSAAETGAEGGTRDALVEQSGGEVQPAFACVSLGTLASDVSQRLCYDFSSASDSSNFTNEAGTWSVPDGTYHGVGPADGQITCPGGPHAGTGMTTSVLTTLSAADVRVHARMTSWNNPDKVLVLRSRASGDRIEINFRSYWANQQGGDVVVQSLVGCQEIIYVAPGTIPVPQYPYQAIEVDVRLRGQRLSIALDGKQVYDDSPTATDVDGGTHLLPTEAGSVGFGVFWDGEDVFDDLVVEVLK
jgi:hypothetical protein